MISSITSNQSSSGLKRRSSLESSQVVAVAAAVAANLRQIRFLSDCLTQKQQSRSLINKTRCWFLFYALKLNKFSLFPLWDSLNYLFVSQTLVRECCASRLEHLHLLSIFSSKFSLFANFFFSYNKSFLSIDIDHFQGDFEAGLCCIRVQRSEERRDKGTTLVFCVLFRIAHHHWEHSNKWLVWRLQILLTSSSTTNYNNCLSLALFTRMKRTKSEDREQSAQVLKRARNR